jgi:release factor glutamine methyltransferase
MPAAEATVAALLRAAGCVFAEEEAALLLADHPTARLLDERVTRRVAGEPLEYVLGWAGFAGLRVTVDPGVFVPRHRSEYLVELAAALLGAGVASARPVVVDLCCGTGALGLAVAARVPGVELHAADLDPAAVACAARNLAMATTTGAGRPSVAHAHSGDLFEALPSTLRGRVDLLVVNAPYVPTDEIATMPPEARDHEHRIALDGGTDGLDLHRRIAADAGAWLRPGAHLLLESSRRQAERSAAHLRDGGLEVRIERDDDATVVVATRPVGPGHEMGSGSDPIPITESDSR